MSGNGNSRKSVKVMFGIPNEGHTEPEAYDNRMIMCFHLGTLQVLSSLGITEFSGKEFVYPENTTFEFYTCSVAKTFTALARERLAEEAVNQGMDYLFMVDDDMITSSDLFELLYRHDVDIVAPLAFSKHPPFKPVIYDVKEGYDSIEKSNYFINYNVMTYPKDQLVQCDAVGFGAVLIKTDVLRNMKKPWFMTTSGCGEDIFFCHSAAKAGFKIHMDTSVKLGHLGEPPIITEEDYEKQEEFIKRKELHGTTSKYYQEPQV